MNPSSSPLTSLLLLAGVFALAPSTASAADLIGEWTFDDTGADSVGSNDATLFGAASYTTGVVGNALSITANTGGASMDNVLSSIGAGPYTISLWVNYKDTFAGHARHEHIITSGWYQNHLGQWLRTVDLFAESAGGATYARANGPTSDFYGSTPAWISEQNAWHHVAIGRDASTQYVCVDGVVFTSAAITSSYDHGASSTSYVGRNPYENGGRSFPGAIDEMQVYDQWVGEEGCAWLFENAGGIYPGSGIDGDGICDASDLIDTDTDGIADDCETDVDGDGVDDNDDNCPNDANPDQADLDSDGTGDSCETDTDGDGIDDIDDNCPLIANVSQDDNDDDGDGDACDDDDDDDGVADIDDNCPVIWNPDQADTNANGSGDACDDDDDGDGVLDADDLCPGTSMTASIGANGCSGEQHVELSCGDVCDHRNNGQYVSCVTRAANDAVRDGLLTGAEKAALTREAAKATCE